MFPLEFDRSSEILLAELVRIWECICESFLPTHSISVASCGHMKIVLEKKSKNPKWKHLPASSAKYLMVGDDPNTQAFALGAAARQCDTVGYTSI